MIIIVLKCLEYPTVADSFHFIVIILFLSTVCALKVHTIYIMIINIQQYIKISHKTSNEGKILSYDFFYFGSILINL